MSNVASAERSGPPLPKGLPRSERIRSPETVIVASKGCPPAFLAPFYCDIQGCALAGFHPDGMLDMVSSMPIRPGRKNHPSHTLAPSR